MGYTTFFEGSFEFDRKLTEDEVREINIYNEGDVGIVTDLLMLHGGDNFKFSRCHWHVFEPGEGLDGVEFDSERQVLAWDQGEKFSLYVPWLDYLINRVIAPMGVKVDGVVEWNGDEKDDVGKIVVRANVIQLLRQRIEWVPADK